MKNMTPHGITGLERVKKPSAGMAGQNCATFMD
jgi:hypothetical protein